MRATISKLLLPVAAVSLFLGFYAALAATNDCDLGDIVLVLGLPGFLFTLMAGGLIFGKISFSLRSRLWILIIALLLGFTLLGFERSHLNETAVENCQ
jgi:hypothetical protein